LIKAEEEKEEDYSIEDNPMNAVLNKS
jgi:hypothetical protein